MNYKQILLILLCFLGSCSLKNNKNSMEDWKVYSSDFIKEHLNKKLSYLDASLEMDTLKNAPLKILYSVNIDCVTCLMKFSFWDKFEDFLKNKYGVSVPVIAVIRSDVSYESIDLKVSEYWDGIWLYDRNDFFIEKNQLYDERFQAVLVDKNDKIRLIGNPMLNEQLTELYEKTIVMLYKE